MAQTLKGGNVATGQADATPLTGDALAAATQLLNISGAPTQGDIASGQDLVAQIFGPLMAQINSAQAPTPTPVPSVASPVAQFLASFGANVADTVRPGLGEATRAELERQQEAQRTTALNNLQQNDAFRREQTGRALATASQAAQAALSAALDSGDDRAATEKALAIARLNSALEKERQIAVERERAGQERRTITHQQQANIGTETFKQELKRTIEGLQLSEPGKTRLNGELELLARFVSGAVRVDPTTGQPGMDPASALEYARTAFSRSIDEQLMREGKFSIPGGLPAGPPQGGLAPAGAPPSSTGLSGLGERMRAGRGR